MADLNTDAVATGARRSCVVRSERMVIAQAPLSALLSSMQSFVDACPGGNYNDFLNEVQRGETPVVLFDS